MFKEYLKEIGYLTMITFNVACIFILIKGSYDNILILSFFEFLIHLLFVFLFYKNSKLWFDKFKEEINKEENFIIHDAELHEELLNNPKYINKDFKDD